SPGAPQGLVGDLSAFLNGQTDRRWGVSVARDGGAPTLAEQADAQAAAARETAMANPLVKSVLDAFPGATIAEVRSLAPPPAAQEDDHPDALDGAGDEDAGDDA